MGEIYELDLVNIDDALKICKKFNKLTNEQYNIYRNNMFFDYVLKNQKDINIIISVLKRLKELGFNDFILEYSCYIEDKFLARLYPEGDISYSYVANPKIISYNAERICYTTDDSNYVIYLNTDVDKKLIVRKEMYLNSLIFDPSTLPKKIDVEHTLGRILSLKEEFAKDASIVSLDDVTSKIADLDKNASDLIREIKDLGDDVNKDELLKYAEDIKISILKAHHASKSVTLKRTKK